MKKNQPKLHKISEEMREWCALLEAELATWPEVTAKSMFGMTAFYRGACIFAAAPRTRALGSQYSVIFKLESPTSAMLQRLDADPRVHTGEEPGKNWRTYELAAPDDLRGALQWMNEAFAATKIKKMKSNVAKSKSSKSKAATPNKSIPAPVKKVSLRSSRTRNPK